MGFARMRWSAAVSLVAAAVMSGPLSAHAGGAGLPPRVASVSTEGDFARLAPARVVLKSPRPLTVAVITDSVGNDPGEWVSMWAGNLATNRYAFVHHFDWQQARFADDVEVMPPGSEPTAEPLTVWNFGWPGGTPARAVAHLDAGVPVTPDLVLVSFGHNLAPSEAMRQHAELYKVLRVRFGRSVPVVMSLAHMPLVPRQGQAQGRVELIRWLRAAKVPFIDERAVLEGPDSGSLFWDSVHPNAYGYRRIADLVTEQLSSAARPVKECAAPSPARALVRRLSLTRESLQEKAVVRTRIRATDLCGKPLANAWVQWRFTDAAGRAVTVSSQTDRAGVADTTVWLPADFAGTSGGVVTDGTTTLQIAPSRVPPAAR